MGPQSAAMPEATHAMGLAWLDPAVRTVDVEAFCSGGGEGKEREREKNRKRFNLNVLIYRCSYHLVAYLLLQPPPLALLALALLLPLLFLTLLLSLALSLFPPLSFPPPHHGRDAEPGLYQVPWR